MPPVRHVGILTAGGDCPGLNAVIRATVKSAILDHGLRVTGFLDGFAGLLENRSRELGFDDVSNILAQGGTILGASNRDDPFRVPVQGPEGTRHEDHSDRLLRNLEGHGIDALLALGGDGTLSIADGLVRKGAPVIGVPKTIDNDLSETDVTFGFDSARAVATEAVDRLHTTAASHHRIMVIEVMGRNAGWIALDAGIAGGGDVILLPEIPFQYGHVREGILGRTRRGRRFSLVVVAEGARCPDGRTVVQRMVEGSAEPVRLGGIGAVVANELEGSLPFEVRYVVLGHLQRGGTPTPLDRVLGTRFGVAALKAAVDEAWGCMPALRGDRIVRVALRDAVAKLKLVDPEGERVSAARSVGVVFGDGRN
jgi:ATP-dependent phosphofructokinase / diphosphate-dependent phosphofructokinase